MAAENRGNLAPPTLVFYLVRGDHLDVWRVLHGQRDLAVWMRDPDTN